MEKKEILIQHDEDKRKFKQELIEAQNLHRMIKDEHESLLQEETNTRASKLKVKNNLSVLIIMYQEM